MSKPLRVLMIEDSEDDVVLTIRALKKGGYDPVYERVEDAKAMRKALEKGSWDVILCDYQMPQFNGLAAIALLKETAIDIPIIIVSGAIGEETAADCMRFGAHDYVMKGNLSRLVPAIQRELNEAESRSKLKLAENALRESERLLRDTQAISKVGGWAYDVETRRTIWTDEVYRIYGIGKDNDLLDFEKSMSFYFEKDQSIIEQAFMNAHQKGVPYDLELRTNAPDGMQKWVRTIGVPVFEDGKITKVVGNIIDITERKQAEEALRKSEEYFRAITENASDIILVVDKKGTITYASPSVDHVLGLKPEELIGKGSLDLIAPDDFQRAIHDFGKAILTERTLVPNAFRVRHKDGSERVLEGVGKSLLKDPSVTGFVMNVRDVTDRRRMEQAMRESEEKYRNILENMNDSYFETDLRGNMTFCNPMVSKSLGYSTEEMAGMHHRIYMDLENAEIVERNFRDIYRENILSKVINYEVTRKGGTKAHIETSLSLIKNKDGRPIGYRGMSRDITARKRAEDALRDSEEKYRALVETTDTGFVIVDGNGMVLDANDNYIRMTGRKTLDEIRNRNVIEWTARHDLERNAQSVKKCFDQGFIRDLEINYVNEKGDNLPVEINATMVETKEGKRILSLIRDITERKQAEEALRASEKRYRELTEFLPISIFEIDAAGSIISFNRTALEVFRYNQEDYKEGMNILQFFAPEEWQRVGENMGQAIQGKSIPGQEYTFLRKDGSTFIGLIYASPIIHKNKPVGIRGAIIDITDRKQAEERYRSIFENAQEGIFQTTYEGRYLAANRALVTILGYDSPEDLMTTVIDIATQLFVNPEDRKVLLKMIEERGPIKGFEAQFYRKDGSIIWVSVNQHAVRDAEGRVLYYEGFNEDITAKRQSIARIRKALGATVQAIVVTVETRDPYTAGHQRRVSDLARAIATEMNLPTDQIDGIRMAAVIHDLGKISVPAEILSKPTKLTDLEFAIIKTHAQSGYDILKDIEFPWPIARMVLEHHERMDGSGYPKGLVAEETLLESRILSVADVVESMASHRPYRPALGIDAALKEIENNKGALYDTGVVDACLRIFRENDYQLKQA